MRKMWTRLRLILSPGIISTTLAPVFSVLFVSFFMLRAVISEGDNDDDDDDKSDDGENGYRSTPTLMKGSDYDGDGDGNNDDYNGDVSEDVDDYSHSDSAGCFLSPTL